MNVAIHPQNTTSILLTGAVIQSHRHLEKNGIQNPFERLTDYLCAISRWLAQPEITHVVYCDASGILIPEMVFENKKFESLSADFRSTTLTYGKGPSESRTIEYVMSHSSRLSGNFYKCTGRLFVRNFASIHHGLDQTQGGFVIRMNPQMQDADTRFFWFDRTEYFRSIRPHLHENFDYHGCILEHVYYRYCRRFTNMPEIELVGRSGHTGRVYLEDYSPEEKETAGELIRTYRLLKNPTIRWKE